MPASKNPIPDPLLQAKRREILALASRHHARSLQVFGSCARGEANAASDVDFLVELGPGATLIDLGSLQMDLQDLLGRKVDVVEPDALHWSIRERVLREAVPL
ncbi:MAG TPA: nucleotidyltransferase family protein [Thermoanaerobaculia bacterium]|nr:nucleotidyltransferase family protein [Thermoanaerobaculia bacterium]